MARPAEAARSRTTMPTSSQSTPVDRGGAQRSVVRGISQASPRAGWKRARRSRSRCSIASASSSTRWSMPRRCSRPWTTSRAISSSRATPWSSGVAGGDGGADDDVAEDHRHVVLVGGKPAAGPRPALVGRSPAAFDFLVDGEGEHVGRARLAQEPLVELGDGGLVDEQTDTSMSSRTPWAPSTSRASAAQRATSMACAFCSSATKTSALIAAVVGPFVGGDDVGDDAGPHHVALGQVHEGHARHLSEHRLQAREPRAPAGHVDLGDVAGHDHLRAEPDAGQEHLHLLGRRVLRLVEDDEAAVEGPAAHEGQGCDLDGAALEQALRARRGRAGRRGRRRAGAGRGRPWP